MSPTCFAAIAAAGTALAIADAAIRQAPAAAPAPAMKIREVAYLKPTLRQFSWFGTSVSVDSDTLVVGAYGEPRYSDPYSGAAYVFTRQGDQWLQQARLEPSTNHASEHFGRSCALFSNAAVIGSYGATGEGAAFVFQRAQNAWTEQCCLKPRAAARNDDFGAAVAITDGIIVVGAPQDRSRARSVDGDPNDNSGISVGAAYVFEQSASGWQQTAYLKASDNRSGSFFGGAVAATSNTIVIGAWGAQGEQNTAKQDWISGAAYVFTRTANGHWQQQACLTGHREEPGGKFGWSAGISGSTIVIGAEDDSMGSASKPPRNGYCGAAYVFDRTDDKKNQWQKTACLTPTETMPGGYFGERLAIAGEIMVITTSLEGGRAYLLNRRNGQWESVGHIVGSKVRKGDYFGSSIAISGRTVVVGASHHSLPPPGAQSGPSSDAFKEVGAVYVFQIGEQ